MDDILFWNVAPTIAELQHKLQEQAVVVGNWIERNKLTLNFKKTRLMLSRGIVDNFRIKFCNETLNQFEKLRYLGVEIVSKQDDNYLRIDFSSVGRDLYRRCSLLSRASSVFGRDTLKMFAQSLIMGKLAYYLPFAGVEASDSLRHLVVGLNRCMRLITGAFPSTPIPLLHASSGIPSLGILIDKFAAGLFSKLYSQDSLLFREYFNWNLTGENLSPLSRVWKFHQYVNKWFAGMGLQFERNIVESPQLLDKELKQTIWNCEFDVFDSIREFEERFRDPKTFHSEICRKYDIIVCSDGSMRSNASPYLGSGGFVVADRQGNLRMEFGETYFPVFSSYQTESLAMRNAIMNCTTYPENVIGNRICIMTDNQGLLKHLTTLKYQDRLVESWVIDIIRCIGQMFSLGCRSVEFVWVPGHRNICWNERADALASKAYANDKNPYQPMIPVSTLKLISKKRLERQFARQLRTSVCESAIADYPDRSYYRDLKRCSKDFKMNQLSKFALRILHSIGIGKSYEHDSWKPTKFSWKTSVMGKASALCWLFFSV